MSFIESYELCCVSIIGITYDTINPIAYGGGGFLSHTTIVLAATLKPLKGELQHGNKLISYERAFKMLGNDMYIAGIGQAVLELLSFKGGSGNHQRGMSLLQKFLEIFGIMRLIALKMMSYLTSHNFQILKIEIFSKLCKI